MRFGVAWAVVQVSFQESQAVIGLLCSLVYMGIPLEVVCKGDAKVLPRFDSGDLVTMDGIRASYLSPLFADPDDLTHQRVEGHLPVPFPGL